MTSNHLETKHWVHVATRFWTDVAMFYLAFVLAIRLRFQDDFGPKLAAYALGLMLGALVFASGIYVSGLYSTRHRTITHLRRALLLAILHILATTAMMAFWYVTLIQVMGRGVMLIGIGMSYAAVLIVHIVLHHWQRRTRDRVAMLVGSPEDEAEARHLIAASEPWLDFRGVVTYGGQPVGSDLLVLGPLESAPEVVKRERLERVLCSSRGISAPALYRDFCRLRYLGVVVMPVIGVYEEFHQLCPLNLITPEWLLHASAAPYLFYIRKTKRAFDVTMSLLGLVALGPVLLLGLLLVKLTSRGPALFCQERLGRFGRTFTLVKLRTMRVDAEATGPEWSQADDPRVTWGGRLLRKYRIDEIPQFVNVLRGDMSFVGPRPERPGFAAALADQVPFFQERLLVQPGITGWAQVNYPYGSSVEDARRKLEYDLYYIKHMSLFLDLFILLDTVRTVVLGGSKKPLEVSVGRAQAAAAKAASGS